jgi:phospholipase/carboxylesterase
VFWQENLMSSIDKLTGITVASTTSSLQGSFGWFLDTRLGRTGPPRAGNTNNTLGIEFGHSHNQQDGSVHLFLPATWSEIVLEKGWGDLHANTASIAGEDSSYILIFGPRDRGELDVVWLIVQCSYAFATGAIP